eukprot:gene47315-47827_t
MSRDTLLLNCVPAAAAARAALTTRPLCTGGSGDAAAGADEEAWRMVDVVSAAAATRMDLAGLYDQ